MGLENEPERAAALCREAQARLWTGVAQLEDDEMRAPSLLPGWSVGHVLTHLARNADGQARRLEGALRGLDLAKYEGGSVQRNRDIERGAGRSAHDILADLRTSMTHLEDVFSESSAAGWPHSDFLGEGDYAVSACAAHRLREVEVHHVDLGIGYTSADWPDPYVEWDLPTLLATVDDRLASSSDRRRLLAWLAGRAPLDSTITLEPW